MSSTRFNVSLIEIETHWSLEDVWDAHQILDAYEEAEEIANRPRRH